MKKKLLFILFIFMLIPTIVFADVSAPERSELKIKVHNPDGAQLYDYSTNEKKIVAVDGKIPFGEILDGYDTYGSYFYINYNHNGYYIKIADVSAIMDISKIEFDNVKDVFYSYKEVTVYEYPYFGAPTVGTIAAGKNLSLKVAKDPYIFQDWYYANVDGVKGWVYVVDGYTSEDDLDNKTALSSLVKIKPGKFMLINPDIKVYSDPLERGNAVNVKLEYGMEFEYTYLYDQIFEKYVQVSLNGKTFWVNTYNQAVQTDYQVLVFDADNAEIYNKFGDYNNPSNVKLTNNKLYDVLYFYQRNHDAEWYLINVDGKQVWVIDRTFDPMYEEDSDKTIGTAIYYNYSEGTIIGDYYSNIMLSESAGTFDETKKYSYSCFTASDGYSACYAKGYGYFSNKQLDSKYQTTTQRTTELTHPYYDVVEPDIDDDDDEVEEEGIEYVYYCLGGCAILAITAFVTIILVKRKKNLKKQAEEPKEEVVDINNPGTLESTSIEVSPERIKEVAEDKTETKFEEGKSVVGEIKDNKDEDKEDDKEDNKEEK